MDVFKCYICGEGFFPERIDHFSACSSCENTHGPRIIEDAVKQIVRWRNQRNELLDAYDALVREIDQDPTILETLTWLQGPYEQAKATIARAEAQT